MATYALVGHPLSHSFSAQYWNDRFSASGLPHSYVNLDLPDLHRLREMLALTPDLKGFNVTIPYKQAIMSLLDEIDPSAAAIGAVNTVTVKHDDNNMLLTGYNTDAPGFLESLLDFLPAHRLKGMRALVLGTGGASHAVNYALQQAGASVTFVSRSAGKKCLTYAELNQSILSEHRLIVNCTPLGTFPAVECAPPLPYEHIGREHYCMDLVYNPPFTAFMREAARRGAYVKNGLQMLLGQARAAGRIWHI